jgi:hypothetical protein
MRPREAFRSQAFTMREEKVNMLWTIMVILVVMWLLGFSFHIAGGLIHLLLVVAVVLLIVNLVRRTA